MGIQNKYPIYRIGAYPVRWSKQALSRSSLFKRCVGRLPFGFALARHRDRHFRMAEFARQVDATLSFALD